MLLRELEVENFRPFEAAAVGLPSNGLVLVAGANNAGKSALLSALDVVAGVGSDTSAWRRAGSADPARVVATFVLSAEERSTLFAASDQRAEFVARGVASRLQFVFEEQPGGNPLLAHVRSEWPGRGLQTLATTGPRKGISSAYAAMVIRGLLPGKDDVDPLLLVEHGGSTWGQPILLETALGSVPQLSPVTQLRSAWASRYYHFRPLRPGTQRSANLTVAPTLAPTGENLAAVLLDLLTNRPESYASCGGSSLRSSRTSASSRSAQAATLCKWYSPRAAWS